jgi:hypothetical protein
MAKSRTLNEIRQSKEYQIAKANADLQQEVALQGGDFIKPTNKPAKSTGEIMLEDQIKKVKDNRTHPCSESTAEAIARHQLQHKSEKFDAYQLQHKSEGKYEDCTGDVKTGAKNPFEHEEVDKTVNQIVEDLQPQIFDTIFQMINDEMTKRYVFDSSEYLTEAGLELFEDEWFEFYHENHGRIMHKLLQNLK